SGAWTRTAQCPSKSPSARRKPVAGSTAATRWTESACRRRFSPGSATTWNTTTARSRRSASSRARSSIRRTGCDHGGREGERKIPEPLVPAEERIEGASREDSGDAGARASPVGQAHARVGLHRLHASEGRGRAAPRGAEEALQRSTFQPARSVRAVLGRLDRRRADLRGDAGDAES